MTINTAEASQMLADIDTIIRKVKQSRDYRLAGAAMILWGAIVVAANLFYRRAALAGWTWLILDAGRRCFSSRKPWPTFGLASPQFSRRWFRCNWRRRRRRS